VPWHRADDVPVAAGRSRDDADVWVLDVAGSSSGAAEVQGVLEYQPEPFWWQRRWRALPRRRRRLVAALAVLVLLAAGALQVHSWMVARELAQRVVLATSLGVWTSSTARPYGYVSYFVAVRNDGTQPLAVTDVVATTEELRLRMRSDAPRPVRAGEEIQILVSVRLTCGSSDGFSPALPGEVSVRRDDGGTAARRVDLQPSALILDAASTLCAVRPALVDHEISGPVTGTAQLSERGS
jgi:hypothetical protein